jgi:hypothetical protein
MYAPIVYELINSGGNCPWCQEPIDKGETITWGTADGKELLVCDMTTQHISNCIHLFTDKLTNIYILRDIGHILQAEKAIYEQTVNIFEKELKRRKEDMLPYVPYFEKELEDKIWGRNMEDTKEKWI